MIGLREFCTLLLAGGMGAGSVVAVQEVKPRITKARAAPKAAKPAAARPAAPPARPFAGEGSTIEDCPVFAPLPGSPLAGLGMPPNQQPDLGGGLAGRAVGPFPGSGPGFVEAWPAPVRRAGSGPGTSPGAAPGTGPSAGPTPTPLPTPGPLPGPSPLPSPGGVVPEPAAWAMMVSGFGLVGLALRRRPSEADRPAPGAADARA